jgi:hypothetical protein
MDIDVTIQIWLMQNEFIAHAYPLDVTSSGQSAEKAKDALNEAVHLFSHRRLRTGNCHRYRHIR